MDKMALARKLARVLAEKRAQAEKDAGILPMLAAGAALAGGAHILGKGTQKAREYNAGFQPGYMPGGH